MTTVDANRRLIVLPSSVSTRRTLGRLAWDALEVLALDARSENGSWVVQGNVRTLAVALSVGKDRSAAALRRLVEAGLVHHRVVRTDGRYAASAYVLDVEACHRAGLRLEGDRDEREPLPCPPAPCPARPDTAARDTDRGQVPSPAKVPVGPESDARTQPSLFDLPTQPLNPSVSPNRADPDHPHAPTLNPAPSAFPSRPLIELTHLHLRCVPGR